MGRVFLDHPGGTRIYSCANCDTPLTNRAELVSTVSKHFRDRSLSCHVALEEGSRGVAPVFILSLVLFIIAFHRSNWKSIPLQ